MRIPWLLVWLAVVVSQNLSNAGMYSLTRYPKTRNRMSRLLQGYADSAPGDSDDLRPERRTPHLAKRSRAQCGPKRAVANTARLSESTTLRNITLGFIYFKYNSTATGFFSFFKASHMGRHIELPDKNLGVFYGNELPRASESIVSHSIADSPEDMSANVIKTFSSPGRRKQYSTGTSHTSRCTTMYIISRKVVHAAHWWKNVSFNPDDEWKEDGRTNDQIFQSTVLDMLTTGERYHPKLDATLIEDSYIKA